MIRGKKNYLPPSHLILGFGILFKLGDDCLENHKNERRVRTLETEVSALSLSTEDTQSTVCYLFLKSKFFLSFVPFYYVGKLLVQRKANDLIFILIHFKMRWVEFFSLGAIFILCKGCFEAFFNHPPTYVRKFSLHIVRENWQFLDHPATPMSVHNIKIAPYTRSKNSKICQITWENEWRHNFRACVIT